MPKRQQLLLGGIVSKDAQTFPNLPENYAFLSVAWTSTQALFYHGLQCGSNISAHLISPDCGVIAVSLKNSRNSFSRGLTTVEERWSSLRSLARQGVAGRNLRIWSDNF
jgi:hypothetical protein